MRVKNTIATHKRRKRILKQAKGYYGAKHKLFKKAKEQVLKSHFYQFRDRKKRKTFFRQLWISRINSALKEFNIKYNVFIHELSKNNILLNRKMLSELLSNNFDIFKAIVIKIKENLKEETN